jgi:hypothetical protein
VELASKNIPAAEAALCEAEELATRIGSGSDSEVGRAITELRQALMLALNEASHENRPV